MKKSLLFSLLFTIFMNAQETEFKFTKDGFTDYVVGIVPNKSASDLYKKTIEWISVAYKNPKEVIKAQIENEYIRIEGFEAGMLCRKILLTNFCENTKYQIEISFKDGKYKFDIIEVTAYSEPSKYANGGWYSIDLQSTTFAYKENGELKAQYKTYPQTFETKFNSLNSDLKMFLESDKIPSKKDGW